MLAHSQSWPTQGSGATGAFGQFESVAPLDSVLSRAPGTLMARRDPDPTPAPVPDTDDDGGGTLFGRSRAAPRASSILYTLPPSSGRRSRLSRSATLLPSALTKGHRRTASIGSSSERLSRSAAASAPVATTRRRLCRSTAGSGDEADGEARTPLNSPVGSPPSPFPDEPMPFVTGGPGGTNDECDKDDEGNAIVH